MNSRGDCQNANRPVNAPKIGSQNIRKPTRREALGQAIPRGVEIQDGPLPPMPNGIGNGNVDPALSDTSSQTINIDPRFDTAQDVADDGLDQFMNLDSHHEIPGFGQQYGSQSQGFY
jgi:hypothetical protein